MGAKLQSFFPITLMLAGFISPALGGTDNPVRPLSEYENDLKPKVRALADQLAAAIRSGTSPSDSVAAYNRGMDQIRSSFVDTRSVEYGGVRETRQEVQLDTEEGPVNPGSARHSSDASATYPAPAEMKFDSFDWKEVSAYGNTTKDFSLADGDTKLNIHLNARSLYKPAGRSRIEVQPITRWRYTDPLGKAHADWIEVNRVINQ